MAMRLLAGDRLLRVVLPAITAGLALPPVAKAHPGTGPHLHERLGLEVSISDQEVLYEIQCCGNFLDRRIPGNLDKLVFILEGDRFRFLKREQEKRQREILEEFFKEVNPVTIDGILVKPILKELQFLPAASLPGWGTPFMVLPDVRILLSYSTKGRPKRVSMVWELYPRDYGRAVRGLDPATEVVAELDAYNENTIIKFTRDEPEVIWHTPGWAGKRRVMPVVVAAEPVRIGVPLASLAITALAGVSLLTLRFSRLWRSVRWPAVTLAFLAIGVAVYGHDVLVVQVAPPWRQKVQLPDEEEAINVFTSLHRNVYRAFDYKTESDIYDVLAQSVDGDLLDRVYNEVYQSLIMRDQGGAVSRVQSVDILDTEVLSAGKLTGSGEAAFRVRSRWRVDGVVYHWGHVHSRTNEYRALYTIAQRTSSWKITGVETLEQQRIVSEGDDPAPSPPIAAKEPSA